MLRHIFSQTTSRGRRWQIAAIVLIFCSCLAPCKIGAQVKPIRRVLIVYELGLSSPSVSVLDQQIRAVLQDSPFQIELYREYLETTLFSDPEAQKETRQGYIHKYRNRTPDVVITLGSSPLRFLVNSHETSFKDVPVLFGGLSGAPLKDVNLDPQFTGVWDRVEPAETLEIALRLQPGTKHVVVVGGMDAFDLELEGWFRERLHSYESKLDVTYLTDLPMQQLLERLRQLPPHTIVLLTHVGADGAGTHFVGASQADPLIVKAANAPVYGPSDVDLGHGEVGGYLDSFALQGKIIGEMAVRILKGERPQDIPVVRGADVYMFDWKALKRWGLNEKNLPPGSIVLNRQPTVWESYKWYIVSGIALILLEALLIGGLVWQRARRRRAEADLAITYDRLRLAVEAGKSVGWDWDVQSGRNQWFGDLQTMFGIPAESYSGHAEDFRRSIHPEDRELVRKAVADARQSRSPYIAEFRVVRADGTVRWITASGKFYYAPNGDPERMLGVAVDITESKQAEESLQQRETELKEAQRLAGLGSWQWEPRTDTVIWSKELYHLMGIDPTLPAPSYKEHAHLFAAESWERLQRAVQEALQTGTSYELDLEVVRPESIAKWEIARGEPVRDKIGRIIGLRGTVQDITDRKLAEEALTDMSRKLVEAQEQERARIGRELHDDVNQRLAMLAIELEQLRRQSFCGSEPCARTQKADNRNLKRRTSLVPRVALLKAGISRCHWGHEKLVQGIR